MASIMINYNNVCDIIEWLKANKKEIEPNSWEYEAEDIPKMQKYLADKESERERLKDMPIVIFNLTGDVDSLETFGSNVIKLKFTGKA